MTAYTHSYNGTLHTSLKVLRTVLVLILIGCLWMSLSPELDRDAAASSAVNTSRRNRVTVGSISLDEFAGSDLPSLIYNYAELDDVDKLAPDERCNVQGMRPALVYGINEDNIKNKTVTDTERAAMLYNTWYLQQVIYCAPQDTAVYLPAGTFYFVSGHLTMIEDSEYDEMVANGEPGKTYERKYERHVIKAKSYITLIGQGIDESGTNTTLKPYSETDEFIHNKKYIEYNGFYWTIGGGIDMFFFNRYSGYNWDRNHADYLVDADFYNFIINSEDTAGVSYNTSGKGFMLLLIKDCDWDHVMVKNTDGTGFGADIPINSTISNSYAYNCGKGATVEDGGGSGFGIGTGYANNESMTVTNSVSVGNTKFGFFYEHQGRFNSYDFEATTGVNEQAFKVIDCYAEDNLYNYGGLRSNDTYYANSVSVPGANTVLGVYFSDESRRVSMDNMEIQGATFDDVDSSAYYYDAVQWALQNGITNGVSNKQFGTGWSITRADATILIWRMAHRDGDVLAEPNGNLNPDRPSLPNIQTCFADVAGDAYYAGAVKWAYDNGVVVGTKGCSGSNSKDGIFEPDRIVTRAEFVTMLWRLAGSPNAVGGRKFSDVADSSEYYYQAVLWAASKGISEGIGDNKFAPNYDCTREQVVTLLYRYISRVNKLP